MAKHEFCIMDTPPKPGQRFDEYNPEWYYPCVSVDDEFIEPLSFTSVTLDMDAFWHTLDRLEKGLCYTGITLIPPSSMARMREVLSGREGFAELIPLIDRAEREGKFIIHFGI